MVYSKPQIFCTILPEFKPHRRTACNLLHFLVNQNVFPSLSARREDVKCGQGEIEKSKSQKVTKPATTTGEELRVHS